MSKRYVIFLLVMWCLPVSQVLAEAVYIENHSFELPGGLYKTAGWDKDDGAFFHDLAWVEFGPAEVPGWESEGEVEDSGVSFEGDNVEVVEDGDWYGFVMGDDPPVWQLTDHTIAAGEVFTLTFDAYSVWDGIEITANLYYDDSGIRAVVASTTVSGIDDKATEAVIGTLIFTAYDAPECIGGKIGIEFDNPGHDDDFQYGTWTAIDDVHMSFFVSYANDIYPLDGTENVPLEATLEWFLEEGYTCNVYFGTGGDPNDPGVIEDSLETTYDPGGLDYDTSYYWRVDTIEPNEGGTPSVLPGAIWSFRTITEHVVILTEPQSLTVLMGDTAEFAVEALSITDIEYEWYKVNKGGGGDILVSTDEVLAINDVQVEDEGYYYCILSNQATEPEPVTTAQVLLMAGRLIGWWKLEGNLSDSVELEVPGAPTHDGVVVGDNPDYVTGIDNDAVDFLSDGRIISIRDSGEYFNFYPQGMTLSVWVKTPTIDLDGVVSKQFLPEGGEELDPVGWVVSVDARATRPAGAYFTMHPYDDIFGAEDDGDIFDGQWHLITVMMDPATETSRLYVDGIERDESEPFDLSAIVMNEEPLIFGAGNQLGLSAYIGQVDDIKIWSYPLEDMDVAMMYLDFNPDKDVCMNQDDAWLEMDFAGEPREPSYCRIDIEDVAEFASAWLDCHIVPECLP